MESTIRASQVVRHRAVTKRVGLAVVVVASPVSSALWTRHSVRGTHVVERLVDGDQNDPLMSRQHATLQRKGGRLVLHDGIERESGWKRSANGTLGPTGERLDEQALPLGPGDTFQTGDTLWLVIADTDGGDEETCLKGYSLTLNEARETVGIVVAQLIRRIEQRQRIKLSVLVTGPRGSGKQVVAREAHRLLQRARSRAPFRQVSAPSLSDGTAAADLFGVVNNYATDVKARPGYFEQADGGILLLDEVGDTPPDAQAKLLNVLQEREVTRLGATTAIAFDCLIIGATNRPLNDESDADDTFRRDLVDRLATFQVALPPLRERPEDIPPLVRATLDELGYAGSLSAPLMREFVIRWWPGNARELRNTIERLVALADHRDYAPDVAMLERVSDTPSESVPRTTTPPTETPQDGAGLKTVRRRPSREELERALEHCGGNRSELARQWGTDPRQIRRWVAYYDLSD